MTPRPLTGTRRCPRVHLTERVTMRWISWRADPVAVKRLRSRVPPKGRIIHGPYEAKHDPSEEVKRQFPSLPDVKVLHPLGNRLTV